MDLHHNGQPDVDHGICGIDSLRVGMAAVASEQSGVPAGAPGEVTFKVERAERPDEEGESYFGK